MYITRPKTQRFLIIPELKQGERWKYAGIVDHPFFKHGPLLQWSGPHGTVMVNRQLFYAMMTNRLEK
jgi:hypothetical protein